MNIIDFADSYKYECCCICGTIKNCDKYLDDVFKNIKNITELFYDYIIIIYYDKSCDNTLNKLYYYQTKFKIHLHINKTYKSLYRTHRLANGRNYCISVINKNYHNYKYFIMMDFDDVCSSNIDISVLKRSLDRDDWDALSFNRQSYYDIWALSIRPFIFSYIHFENADNVLNQTHNYISNKLNNLDKNRLLKCYSAFNGFSIYKTNIFKDCVYDGRIRLDLIPTNLLFENMKKNNSKIVFNNYDWLNIYNEDCEHRSFHFDAIKRKNARIFISPEMLFLK